MLQCILSIFPASLHYFCANILVFVNINPFLYINDQFALCDSKLFVAEGNIFFTKKTEKSVCPFFVQFFFFEYWHSNNKSPVLFLGVSPTWIILGVLCNEDIWIVSSVSFLGCGEIFDFGILRTIRFETCFLMSITSEPINVIYMHII